MLHDLVTDVYPICLKKFPPYTNEMVILGVLRIFHAIFGTRKALRADAENAWEKGSKRSRG
jgi:hypothetical protein